MADIRVTRGDDAARQVSGVSSDGDGQAQRRGQEQPQERRAAPGAEELAVAFSEDGSTAIEARYEQDADGNPRIRIIDRERGETIAIVTPEELRALAEQTGLPPGLLLHTST